MKALSENEGKEEEAGRGLVDAAAAVPFPSIENAETAAGAEALAEFPPRGPPLRAALVVVSFRASAQAMVESWVHPFGAAFAAKQEEARVFHLSVLEPWYLRLPGVRGSISSGMARAAAAAALKAGAGDGPTSVFAFGDAYNLRKALAVTNTLSCSAFLLDAHGHIRWRASGKALPAELEALVHGTETLLAEGAP